MKILHLTLKKKWFDDILYGGKDEEYREIKEYWIKRLIAHNYTHVKFTNGYGDCRPSFVRELNSINRGPGLVKWGAPESKAVFILKLGRISDIRNLEAA
ncbi:ASCH domain-containing protein [Candidatus Pacearchaeota archaeon]|nr:ASCH domain-containing protein [Candidatus Pacearchaeota archaeon]